MWVLGGVCRNGAEAGPATAGRYDTTHVGALRGAPSAQLEPTPVPDEPVPGRALVTRRAIVDVTRTATLGSYGVAGLAAGPVERLRAFLEGRPAGIRASIVGGHVNIALRLRVAHGLPVAEVARQVDSAVRYAIRRATGAEVDRLSIRVGGLETRAPAQPRFAASDGRDEGPVLEHGTDRG